MSLTSWWLSAGLAAMTVGVLTVLLRGRHLFRRRALDVATTAVLVTAGVWWMQTRYRFVQVHFPDTVWLGVLLLVAALVTPIVLVVHRRIATRPTTDGTPREGGRALGVPRRRTRWTRGGLGALGVATALVGALAFSAVEVNRDYAYLPTLSSLWGGGPTSKHTTLDGLRRAQAARQHLRVAGAGTHAAPGVLPAGMLIATEIPAPTSGFAARPGWLWVPPVYVAGRTTDLPVVMLLAGAPGRTSDWLDGGNAARTLQRFADQHAGWAPVLVLPDANGSATTDTECVDSRRGRAETYLTQDVPTFVRQRLGLPTARWAVGGLSEGGTCSAMLALRHPDLFAAFANFSGLTGPTVSERVNPDATTRQLFDGDRSAYDRHDPLWMLANRPAPAVLGYWAAGSDDRTALEAQRVSVQLARSRGLAVCAAETADAGHSFTFWTHAFAESLPRLAAAATPHAPAATGCQP